MAKQGASAQTAHTPAPWAVEDPMSFNLAIVEADKPVHEWRFIATVPIPDDREDETCFPLSEAEANARLIAAAPDLLAALKFASDQLDELINRHYGGEIPCTDEEAAGFALIEAAILKAEAHNG